MAADFEIRRREPSALALELGMDYSLFVVWDLQADKRVPFGNYRRHDQAVARILRERRKRRGMREPFGCALCGIPKRAHALTMTINGPHVWQAPTQDQILTRMRDRRAERQKRQSSRCVGCGETNGPDCADGRCCRG